jgi:hypothetical protein
LSLPGSYQNLITYCSRIQCILVDPGRCDGPMVPNPKTPRVNEFLKVCAEFRHFARVSSSLDGMTRWLDGIMARWQ